MSGVGRDVYDLNLVMSFIYSFSIIASTFRLDAYETGSAWQLLVAELQGQQERIENFLNMNDIIALLQSQSKFNHIYTRSTYSTNLYDLY